MKQSYVRTSKRMLIMQNRYAHARQYKRSRKREKKLKTIMGRLTRDITRKLDFCRPGNQGQARLFYVNIPERLMSAKNLGLARKNQEA